MELSREPVPQVTYTKFAKGYSLEILVATIQELKESVPGQLFQVEIKGLDPRSRSQIIRMSLCRVPEQVAEKTWLIDFHTHHEDMKKVRYGEFVLPFTEADLPMDDGKDGQYFQLYCLQVPEHFFKLL